ncbi:MAG TPA: class I SAM-dependent methyltransferase [Croceibacterium sp.]|nr:class I SAM-dependent methyltransferase [Croceibacterium sp.]
MTPDSAFAGSIPALYDECLVPVLFAPFAADLVARAEALAPGAVLELAAGTGAVSHALAAALPRARIVATDLNPAMLAVAAARGAAANLAFEPADAQSLPFPAQRFDLVLAQFGAMFFPDKAGAYAEARRVLAPGGTLLFNVWDRLEANTGSAAIHQAVRAVLPEPKPEFIARTPFGYHDAATIEADLRAGGFAQVAIERVGFVSPPGSAAALARGMCLGSPLANELAAHPPAARERALAAAREAAERAEAEHGGLAMAALVIAAR